MMWGSEMNERHKYMFPDRHWGPGDNPKTAVWEYLKSHPEFEIDKTIQQSYSSPLPHPCPRDGPFYGRIIL